MRSAPTTARAPAARTVVSVDLGEPEPDCVVVGLTVDAALLVDGWGVEVMLVEEELVAELVEDEDEAVELLEVEVVDVLVEVDIVVLVVEPDLDVVEVEVLV